MQTTAKIRCLTTLCLSLLVVSRSGAEAPRWEPNLAAALQRARSEKRLVVVDFWRDNCVYCVRLEKETFTDPEVQKLLATYVPVRIKNTEHPEAIKKYGVGGYPTLAILDGDGNAVEIQSGYQNPEGFISWLNTFSQRYHQIRDLIEKIESDPNNVHAMLELGRIRSADGKWSEAREILERIIGADPKGRKRETAEAHMEMGLIARRSREFERAVELLSRARELALEHPWLRRDPAAVGSGDSGKKDKNKDEDKDDGKKKDGQKDGAREGDQALLEKVLYEFATAQLLAGKRADLIGTLREYDARIRQPDRYHHAWVLHRLGLMHKKNGDLEKARAAYEKCNKLYPRSREARESRSELRSLKG